MANFLSSLFRNRSRASVDVDDEPIREELFSLERLEHFASQLALDHTVSNIPQRGSSLLPRLEENGRKLISAYRSLAKAIGNESTISPAAEWLVDNFHIVEEQLREIREDLPRSYYYELPKLTSGQLAGYPRIYAVALALVAHTDSRLDSETLRRFIRAYQSESPLTIGELWAVAISLRVALVENLRRLTTRVVASREEREEADVLADKLLSMSGRSAEELTTYVSERWKRSDKFGRAFIVHFVQRLRDQDPSVMAVLDWLEQYLVAQGSSIEQLVHLEHQRQATAQVTVGNIITSMRLLSTLDWRDFFEDVSLIDPILGSEPAGAYSRMEFASRDRYRHVVEKIAKRTQIDELDVARHAVELAAASARSHPEDTRLSHVGYYLIDKGLLTLEKELEYRPRLDEKLRRSILRHPTLFYLGSLTTLTAIIAAGFLYYAYRYGASPLQLVACAALVLIPASDLALGVLNWDVTRLFKPHSRPRMNTEKGVPEGAQTMIVIPTLFTNVETVQELLERLEVRYLANQDEQFSFGLLGDYVDAPAEEMPEDEAILDAAIQGIANLNARYFGAERQRFFLFHRRRQWNESEGKWIGWERKRGKLHEFNRLLRGASETSFIVSTADPAFLKDTRYVITLDSDTQLPRDAARRLVGIITHPLNGPHFDRASGRITEGYAILQPRVSISLTSASHSLFARIFSGNTGVDPYTTAVSDVYQDLFGEGSYTGKGLYDVDAFELALADRVPENSLLSHDLFESLYARAALVSDIELLDDYPAYYDTYAKRQHRWTRGDWQIARWLMPHVPNARRQKVRNQLPLIARWKIFDNLRRSLVAPMLLLWLLAAWTVLPGSPVVWTLFAMLVLAFPVYAHVTTSLLIHPRGIPWTSHFWSVWGDVRTNTAQVALTISFLAHQSQLMVDAIVRTLYRKLISRKKLLEWVTAAQAEASSKHDRKAYLRFMWPAEPLTAVILLLTLWYRPNSWPVALPFLLVWSLSPLVAHWVSRHTVVETQVLTAKDAAEARRAARRTWRYFETFVGPEDNWLPPDNFQEDPQPVIAHRTSPTNIGLHLLSTIVAHDFGYTGTLEVFERLNLTLTTLKKLQRFRGHFLNWYDTRTLEPLSPQYISTVDSGNLAGHLVALKQSCLDISDRPLFDARLIRGLGDTIDFVREAATRLNPVQQRTQVVSIRELRKEIDTCANLVAADLPQSLGEWGKLFEALGERATGIEDIVAALVQEHGGNGFEELSHWVNSLLHQTRALRRDFNALTPWAARLKDHLSPIIDSFSPDINAEWRGFLESMDAVPSLSALPAEGARLLEKLNGVRASMGASSQRDAEAALNALEILASNIEEAATGATNAITRVSAIVLQCDRYVEEMDFRFLMDEERKVFVIGYNVAEGRRDNSYYDLLASEARLTSFIAIAKGDVPQDHWFRLGRLLTPVDGQRALVSWTATMFEYLMPVLVMRDFRDTLLGETYRAIVARQIEYGYERGVPWGISESAYNARDLQLTYQYGPFGVPGLGLKRGLSQDLVIAPYATMLAGMIDPFAAKENLDRLAREGALGRYGFYEAIDYTPDRLPQNQKRVIIQAYMTHHQGMSLVAIDNVLNGNIMQERFHADPLVQATELLLQERIPINVPITRPRAEEVLMGRVVRGVVGPVTRRYETADLPTPRVQLLSNGTYTVMVTTAGAGYSSCSPLAVTRWREDVTCDQWGSFCYLRDVRSANVWSAGFKPTGRTPSSYEVSFSEDKAEFWRNDGGILTHTEIIVSPEDNAEVRRVSVTNQTSRVREIELTSFMEVVLAPAAADAAHPAFSNLFIETEFVASENALLARRRKRSETDEPIWGIHTVVTEGETVGAVQYETDRGRFLGRGHDPSAPVAVMEDRPLSNTTGTVLDPCFCLRQRVRLKPNERARVSFATAVAHSHEEAIRVADKYHDASTFEREARLAWTKSKVEMLHLKMEPEEAHLFQRLAGRLLYSDPSLRPRRHVLALNTQSQSALWAYSISGDLPIVLVRIGQGQADELDMVRQILRAHEYLRMKGLSFDLVILNDRPFSYLQELQDDLQALVRKSGSQALLDKPGGVYLRRSDVMSEADKILLHTVARVVIVTDRGSLEEQLVRRPSEHELPPAFLPRRPSRTYPEPAAEIPELSFFNGLGGFSPEGREYVIVLGEGQWTPAPWLNVIANGQDFGFQVTEAGASYTWSINSRENRLTPWSNDAVSDPPGEVIYLRDEDTGTIWTPTPLPIREGGPYVIRHGQGYTVFERTSHGVAQELLQFVPLDAPVKISLLRLRNQSDRKRRLSVTTYNELVLGVQRSTSAPFINTGVDEATGAITARNSYNNEFAQRITFVEMSEDKRALTCDRKEFIGRNGSLTNPAALRRTTLSGRVGAGLDPCAAMQGFIELAPGESRQIVILLGQTATIEEARRLVTRFRKVSEVENAFERVLGRWDELLGTLAVSTPDAAMDTLLNRWLLYQALACRVWSRSAFYQSGGAYGFRDQLQDVMALVYSNPDITREQIVRAASRQFKEGDVQHWWHPPTGRGVRTRISDDLLWLPYVTRFYVEVTGDRSVLDEVVPFIDAPPLAPDESESYRQPTTSAETGTVYEHCVRAIDRSLTTGVHGLPLMGSGDWNDGMNRVGHQGKGESVWVGWFLHNTLEVFVPICEARDDSKRAETYRQHMSNLKRALEAEAWDGDWYRRAYFDDGTPLGSAQNEECRIDSIVQSWGVISGAADNTRAARAMSAVEQYLIRRGDGLVILFTPPFDKSPIDPGYIKGYVPGVRENGGQYTHAALWTLIAYAKLGDGDRAGELFALLNPISHASTRAGLHKYKAEPYVAAGDIYAVPPHTGRGGWTWYTGSASWMYRAGLESILGFELHGDTLQIEPCIPRSWRGYELNYRRGSTRYAIKVENPLGVSRGVAEVWLDDALLPTIQIPLTDDGNTHHVRVVLGEREPTPDAQTSAAQIQITSSQTR